MISRIICKQYPAVKYVRGIEENNHLLNSFIEEGFNNLAHEMKTSRLTKPYALWLTTNIKCSFKQRDQAFTREQKTNETILHINVCLIWYAEL